MKEGRDELGGGSKLFCGRCFDSETARYIPMQIERKRDVMMKKTAIATIAAAMLFSGSAQARNILLVNDDGLTSNLVALC